MLRCSISAGTSVVSENWEGYRAGSLTAARWLLLMTLVAFMASARVVTPKDLLAHPPTRYFNDYAQVVQPASSTYLNNFLANFERGTSNQILVVIFPEWPTEVVFDDFAQDLFRSAKIGQPGRNNGALVSVSIKELKIRNHTGTGLGGALSDALCIRIIRDDPAPQFRTGNYDEGFRQGAVMAAVDGEYHGDGKTAAEQNAHNHGISGSMALVIFVLLVLLPVSTVILAFRLGHMYRIRGSRGDRTGGGDAGGSSDGGSRSGGDSGFSDGDGDSGGGASSDW